MIKKFVDLWDKYKGDVEQVIRTTRQESYDEYSSLVRLLVDNVINKGDERYCSKDMTVIDNGDYQGTEIFIIPRNTYQPDFDDYIVTYVEYGSCSGCDTLLAIAMYGQGLPNDEQVDDYMTLLLHLLQRFKYLGDDTNE